MKRFIGIILVLLLISPLAAYAQDGPKMEEFVSEDELLTLQYPKDWVIEELGSDLGLPGIQMGNSEDALDLLIAEEIPEDAVGLMVILLPYDLLAAMGEDVPVDPTPAELAEFVATTLLGPTDEQSGVEVSEPEAIELESELEVGYITFKMEITDGSMIAYEKDGVLVWLITMAYPGSYTDDVDEIVRLIADSIKYEGTPDDLMNAMMAPTSEETAEPAP